MEDLHPKFEREKLVARSAKGAAHFCSPEDDLRGLRAGVQGGAHARGAA